MKTLQPSDPMYKVVFTDDEEIHGDVTLQVSGRKKLLEDNSKSLRAGSIKIDRNRSQVTQVIVDVKEQMTAADWDRRFE